MVVVGQDIENRALRPYLLVFSLNAGKIGNNSFLEMNFTTRTQQDQL